MIEIIESSLRKVHPDLSNKGISRLATYLLESIAEKIFKGEQIASVRTLADGSIDLSILQIEPNAQDYKDKRESLPSRHNTQLKVEVPVPPLIDVDDFVEYATEPIKAIDFIYYLLYFISTNNNYSAILDLSEFINDNFDVVFSSLGGKEFLYRYSERSSKTYPVMKNVKPLQILSVHYGSPISFDLLGVGSILEFIRDVGKDALWRANHEKLLAKAERDLKSTEVEKARLEIANQKMALEKMALELALQKVELLERLYNLPLGNKEQTAIASVIVPRIIAIVDKKASLSLVSEATKKVD